MISSIISKGGIFLISLFGMLALLNVNTPHIDTHRHIIVVDSIAKAKYDSLNHVSDSLILKVKEIQNKNITFENVYY